MPGISVFTCGKSPVRNEDALGYTDQHLVIADGATSKNGKLYEGKTGGELISGLIVEECMKSVKTGVELVDLLNAQVSLGYESLKVTDYLENPLQRFAAGFIDVQMREGKVILTYLGDLGFRINGTYVYQEQKLMDLELAKLPMLRGAAFLEIITM